MADRVSQAKGSSSRDIAGFLGVKGVAGIGPSCGVRCACYLAIYACARSSRAWS